MMKVIGSDLKRLEITGNNLKCNKMSASGIICTGKGCLQKSFLEQFQRAGAQNGKKAWQTVANAGKCSVFLMRKSMLKTLAICSSDTFRKHCTKT